MKKETDPEQLQLRSLGAEEFNEILAKHSKWLAAGRPKENELEFRANLSNVDLKYIDIPSGTNLSYSILAGAHFEYKTFVDVRFESTDFTRAKAYGCTFKSGAMSNGSLRFAKLCGADLRLATFIGVDCFRSNFFGANLVKSEFTACGLELAYFGESDLRDSRLKDTSGMASDVLGGADLTGCHLPTNLKKFAGIDQVNHLTSQAKRLLVVILLLCAYSWLTIGTTLDVNLLTDAGTSPLPLIGANIPIKWFYLFVPLMLLAIYAYFHLCLQRLWEELAHLPDVLPDGRTLDRAVYPWILSGFVHVRKALIRRRQKRYRSDLAEPRRGSTPTKEDVTQDPYEYMTVIGATPQDREPELSRLESVVALVLGWCVAPLTLVWFWLRCIPLHSWVVTTSHILLLVISSSLGFVFYSIARDTLLRTEIVPETRVMWLFKLKISKLKREIVIVSFLICSFLLFLASLTMISGLPAGGESKIARSQFGIPNYTGPSEIVNDVDTIPPETVKDFGVTSSIDDIPKVPTLNLIIYKLGFDIAAELQEQDVSTKPQLWTNDSTQIPLVKGARLGGQDLRHVVAYRTFLVNADLRSSNLDDGYVYESDFRFANLDSATLRGCYGWRSQFQNARLVGSNFTNAKLNDSRFAHSTMRGAIFDSATVNGANFRQADMQEVRFVDASLQNASLYEANLARAQFIGTDLSHAKFTRAVLDGAKFRDCDFTGADLSAVDLKTADVSGADFRGATVNLWAFRPDQIRSAVFDSSAIRLWESIQKK